MMCVSPSNARSLAAAFAAAWILLFAANGCDAFKSPATHGTFPHFRNCLSRPRNGYVDNPSAFLSSSSTQLGMGIRSFVKNRIVDRFRGDEEVNASVEDSIVSSDDTFDDDFAAAEALVQNMRQQTASSAGDEPAEVDIVEDQPATREGNSKSGLVKKGKIRQAIVPEKVEKKETVHERVRRIKSGRLTEEEKRDLLDSVLLGREGARKRPQPPRAPEPTRSTSSPFPKDSLLSQVMRAPNQPDETLDEKEGDKEISRQEKWDYFERVTDPNRYKSFKSAPTPPVEIPKPNNPVPADETGSVMEEVEVGDQETLEEIEEEKEVPVSIGSADLGERLGNYAMENEKRQKERQLEMEALQKERQLELDAIREEEERRLEEFRRKQQEELRLREQEAARVRKEQEMEQARVEEERQRKNEEQMKVLQAQADDYWAKVLGKSESSTITAADTPSVKTMTETELDEAIAPAVEDEASLILDTVAPSPPPVTSQPQRRNTLWDAKTQRKKQEDERLIAQLKALSSPLPKSTPKLVPEVEEIRSQAVASSSTQDVQQESVAALPTPVMAPIAEDEMPLPSPSPMPVPERDQKVQQEQQKRTIAEGFGRMFAGNSRTTASQEALLSPPPAPIPAPSPPEMDSSSPQGSLGAGLMRNLFAAQPRPEPPSQSPAPLEEQTPQKGKPEPTRQNLASEKKPLIRQTLASGKKPPIRQNLASGKKPPIRQQIPRDTTLSSDGDEEEGQSKNTLSADEQRQRARMWGLDMSKYE